MNFHIIKLSLWLKNGKLHSLSFEPKKINMITGKSNRGKTAILGIIDYCLFASRPEIAESKINENVLWYGITFCINDKRYTIARRAYKTISSPSEDYYFSSVGEIPLIVPQKNITEKEIKSIIEAEFSIDQNTKFPYGGKFINANSKISLRYFLIFNTISEDIIQSKQPFFDKMNSNRYREALDRIFDLAMQIDTIENRLKKEKRDDLQRSLEKLNNKKECGVKGKEKFSKELAELIAQAKSYGFIPMEDDLTLGIKHLQLLLKTEKEVCSEEKFSRAEQIRSEIMSIRLKLSKINKFNREYARYKKDALEISDSLKPVNFLMSSDDFLIQGTFFERILETLQADIHTIRESIKNKTPIDIQVLDLQSRYEAEIKKLDEELNLYPKKIDSPSSLPCKYRFLGTIEEKFKLYHNPDINIVDTIEKQITETTADIENIRITDNTERRTLTIDLIQDFVKNYMNIVGGALDNYQHYMPYFDYSKKTLGLRKPQSTEVDYIGSSSNHMFLHLFFSLALHATAVVNKSPYVLPFLIIDQPSRPYYGNDSQGNQNEDYNSSDEGKILKAFKLLDSFMKNEPINNSFQMIVFEHIPEKLITPDEFSSIHIVGDFFNDALIPLSELSQLEESNNTAKS